MHEKWNRNTRRLSGHKYSMGIHTCGNQAIALQHHPLIAKLLPVLAKRFHILRSIVGRSHPCNRPLVQFIGESQDFLLVRRWKPPDPLENGLFDGHLTFNISEASSGFAVALAPALRRTYSARPSP